MPLTDADIKKIALESAKQTWLYDFKRPDGTPNKPIWLLQSLDAIISDAVAKTAQATAKAILNAPLPDVRTGGKTTLAAEVSWAGANAHSIMDKVGAVPTVDLPADYAEKVSAAIDQKLSELHITFTAGGAQNG